MKPVAFEPSKGNGIDPRMGADFGTGGLWRKRGDSPEHAAHHDGELYGYGFATDAGRNADAHARAGARP